MKNTKYYTVVLCSGMSFQIPSLKLQIKTWNNTTYRLIDPLYIRNTFIWTNLFKKTHIFDPKISDLSANPAYNALAKSPLFHLMSSIVLSLSCNVLSSHYYPVMSCLVPPCPVSCYSDISLLYAILAVLYAVTLSPANFASWPLLK